MLLDMFSQMYWQKKDFFIVHCMQSLPVLIKFYELVKIKYAPK